MKKAGNSSAKEYFQLWVLVQVNFWVNWYLNKIIVFQSLWTESIPLNVKSQVIQQFSIRVEIIRDCFDFALLRSVISSENLRHFLNQSD